LNAVLCQNEKRTVVRHEHAPRIAGDGAERIGILLVNSGTPAAPEAREVRKFLAKFLGDPRVVDLSGDFRLHDAATYKRYYGADHPCPQMLDGTFIYGLPELNREAIRGARWVASPGCFATTIELGLLPLARARFKTWMSGTSPGKGILRKQLGSV